MLDRQRAEVRPMNLDGDGMTTRDPREAQRDVASATRQVEDPRRPRTAKDARLFQAPPEHVRSIAHDVATPQPFERLAM